MNVPISSFQNFKPLIPPGDNQERMVCTKCEWIHYDNPRIILTGLCLWQNQVLLCRRAIPPRYGFWTLPGGFLEIGETTEEGTKREVREEAGAEVQLRALLAIYSVARIGQVHLVYVADMVSSELAAGPESLEAELFPLDAECLPWEDLAFPVNHWALQDYLSLGGRDVTQPFSTRPEHRNQRMKSAAHHPDFPPPDSQYG